MQVYHTDIHRKQSYSFGAATSAQLDRHDTTIRHLF